MINSSNILLFSTSSKFDAWERISANLSTRSALKRFKKKIQKAGILSEIKRRERYEKPSVKRKRKSEAARKRKV